MKKSLAHGFTLIELVVVITILGILAAFAVPRFISLETQARAATINSLAGSVKSAASLARGMAMATAAGSAGPVTMEGQSVALVNSYPDSGAGGIANALSPIAASDFTFTPGSPVSTGTATWTKVGATTPANCVVSYVPAASAGAAPTVSVNTAGC